MADEKKPPKKRSTKSKSKKNKQDRDEPVAGAPRGPGDVNPVDIHRDYVEQHRSGGAPPTRQAYDEALKQWRKLPGAVVGVARDVQPVTEPPEGEPDDPEGESDQEEQSDDPKDESS